MDVTLPCGRAESIKVTPDTSCRQLIVKPRRVNFSNLGGDYNPNPQSSPQPEQLGHTGLGANTVAINGFLTPMTLRRLLAEVALEEAQIESSAAQAPLASKGRLQCLAGSFETLRWAGGTWARPIHLSPRSPPRLQRSASLQGAFDKPLTVDYSDYTAVMNVV
ncbi:hypothetical protein NDU88_004177 [Pleurodeles waltl]|uniref:Uncharacterized protein n=1 Tax=Pleurodeles waltl TaxID=8319 RepID=A0AAV7T6Q8_PLEWA|nr:hypothetical protein NDU88_004177 [Pleurodeles waltl]